MYEDAYPVPFRLECHPPAYTFVNESDEPVHGVAVILHGPGRIAANAPAKLQRGEGLEVTIEGERLERGTILVVRWFRPDGTEYLWRVSF